MSLVAAAVQGSPQRGQGARPRVARGTQGHRPALPARPDTGSGARRQEMTRLTWHKRRRSRSHILPARASFLSPACNDTRVTNTAFLLEIRERRGTKVAPLTPHFPWRKTPEPLPQPRPRQQVPAPRFGLCFTLHDLGPRTCPRSTVASPRVRGR